MVEFVDPEKFASVIVGLLHLLAHNKAKGKVVAIQQELRTRKIPNTNEDIVFLKFFLERATSRNIDPRVLNKTRRGDLDKERCALMESYSEFQEKIMGLLEKFCDACNFKAPDWDDTFYQVKQA